MHMYFNKTFNVHLYDKNHSDAGNLVHITLALDEFIRVLECPFSKHLYVF